MTSTPSTPAADPKSESDPPSLADTSSKAPLSAERASPLPVPVSTAAPPGPHGTAVSAWFDDIADTISPLSDGTLMGARRAATDFARLAKAENTRRAYRSTVRAWCAWCDRHGLSPLPARGIDVAAFLADERSQQRAPETLKLRRAAIRYLHRAAGHPVPTDDVCVSETMAGIERDAARQSLI